MAGMEEPNERRMEMDSFDGKAKSREQLLWFWTWRRLLRELVSQWYGRGQRKIFRVLSGYFEHQRRVQFEGCVGEPLKTITAILPWSKWSCLLLRILLQGALSGVTRIYPSLQLRVFVDDITAFVKGVNREVAEAAKKVMKKLQEEINKKAGKCRSLTMGRKGRAR